MDSLQALLCHSRKKLAEVQRTDGDYGAGALVCMAVVMKYLAAEILEGTIDELVAMGLIEVTDNPQ